MFFNEEHNSLMNDAIYARYCETDARKLSDKTSKLCIINIMKTRDNQTRVLSRDLLANLSDGLIS